MGVAVVGLALRFVTPSPPLRGEVSRTKSVTEGCPLTNHVLTREADTPPSALRAATSPCRGGDILTNAP